MTSFDTEQRLARMRAVWAETAPDALDVMRAKRRYVQRSRQGGSTRLVWDLALGASFAATTLLAYQLYLDGSQGLVADARAPSAEVGTGVAATPSHEPVAEQGVSGGEAPIVEQAPSVGQVAGQAGVAPSQPFYIERAGERVLLEPGVEYHVAQGEHITLVLPGQRQEIRGPKVLQVTLEADRAAGFRVHLSERPERASKAVPAVRSSEKNSERLAAAGQTSSARASADSNDAWVRAAEALRRGDTAAAEAALSKLSQSPRAATRQAAELALAQLWFSSGQKQRAKPLLMRLAEQAEAPVVQKRARELLAEL